MLTSKINVATASLNYNRIAASNFLSSLLLRVVSVGLTFGIVPLFVGVLGKESYGIWVTLYSVASWITLLDLGIGQGLRYHLTNANAHNDHELARGYISSAFFALISGSLMILVALLVACFVLNINVKGLLGIQQVTNWELQACIFLLVAGVLTNQISSVFGATLVANHASALVATPQIALSCLMMVGVAVLSLFPGFHSIAVAGSIFLIASIIVNSIFPLLVMWQLPQCTPLSSSFSKQKLWDLMHVGLKFTLIQFAFLAIFSTDRIIVLRLFGPDAAAEYDVAFKVFAIIPTVFTMLMTPYWAIFSQAYTRGETEWIKTRMWLLSSILLLVIVAQLMICFCTPIILQYCFGSVNVIDGWLSGAFIIYSAIVCWNTIFATFLNSIARTKEQITTSSMAAVINVPLSIILAYQLNLGVTGIVLGSCCSLALFGIVGPIVSWNVLTKARPS